MNDLIQFIIYFGVFAFGTLFGVEMTNRMDADAERLLAERAAIARTCVSPRDDEQAKRCEALGF